VKLPKIAILVEKRWI